MKEDLLRDDSACREAFKRGDRAAMGQVYKAYLPLVRTICTHGVGNFRGFFDPVDRDDAIQNIFATAFEERARLRYNGIDPYAAFLRGIAHNVVRKMLDKKRRFDRRPEESGPDSEDMESAYLDHEKVQVVKRFREGVTEEPDKTVLNHYFCEGWAEEKLAGHLGITRHRVRKVIARLHKRMTSYLKNHGITTA